MTDICIFRTAWLNIDDADNYSAYLWRSSDTYAERRHCAKQCDQ